jgi:EAL domain-containing protein (putative c-di-GMP-specific phosphodiesterase class I)/GGDEF domain-containing protein
MIKNAALISIVTWLFALSATAHASGSVFPDVDRVEAQSLAADNIHAALEAPESLWGNADNPINLGYDDRAVWYRIDVSHYKGNEFVLEVGYPILDSLEFYRVDNGRVVRSLKTGDKFPYQSRDIQTRTFAFDLKQSESNSAVYLRAETEGSHKLPITISTKAHFFEKTERDSSSRALFYGMFIVTFIVNLLLFFSMRTPALFYFSFAQLGILAIISTVQGVVHQYLTPQNPHIQELILLFAPPFTVYSLVVFAREFLTLKENWRAGYRATIVMEFLAVLSGAMSLILPYSLSTRFLVIIALVITLGLLGIGLGALYRKIANSAFFVAGWCAFLLGVIIYLMGLSGILPSHFLVDRMIEFGAVVSSVLLVYALGRSMDHEKQERLKEQNKNIKALVEIREAREKSILASRRHALTGVPNRSVLEEYLQLYDESPSDQQRNKLALLFIDFSNLGEINKTIGHERADAIFVEFVTRLNDKLTELDIGTPVDPLNHEKLLCHVESATFAVVIPGNGVDELKEQVYAAIEASRQPLCYERLTIDPNSVCGCSVYPDRTDRPQALMRHAFIAFDEAVKKIDRFSVYSNENDKYSEERLTLMGDLREALENDGLALHYQPQMNLMTREVNGFEALIRWNHETRGFVPPDHFIPIAETTGIITDLTRWVLDSACQFLSELKSEGTVVRVAVNISALNLREKGFVDQVVGLIEKYDLEPSMLSLEVTETAAMQDPERSLRALQRLHVAGIILSIDDYGTGQSSLQYIKNLPVDEIKIDRSFVMSMHESSHDETIVRTTITMCHLLGYRIVAEGVENQEIENLLKDIDCDYAQGYYYAKPQPPEQAKALLLEKVLPAVASASS